MLVAVVVTVAVGALLGNTVLRALSGSRLVWLAVVARLALVIVFF
jgi:hypothetical protein